MEPGQTPTQPPISTQPTTKPIQTPIEPKKSFSKWPFVIVAIIIVIVVIMLLPMFLLQIAVNKLPSPQVENQVTNPTLTPVPTITSSNSEVLTATDTATWKTYTNSSLGFSVKYPDDWNVDDLGDNSSAPIIDNPQCIKLLQHCGYFQIEVRNISSSFTGKSAKDYFSSTTDPNGMEIITAKNVIIDGENGYLVDYNRPAGNGDKAALEQITVLYEKRVYSFNISEQDLKGNYLNAISAYQFYSLFNQMLSTFKFTP